MIGRGITQRRSFTLLALLPVLLVSSGEAQQSYRSYQQLSGRILGREGQSGRRPSSDVLTRFRGWKHPVKSKFEYSKRFHHPRARTVHAELLENAARTPGLGIAPAQFAPSSLPGFLFRDSLPAGYIPNSVVTGDFNGDGKPDFVVANSGDNNLWLYFGNGDGTFNLPVVLPITLGQTPTWVGTADLRGIGRADLIVAEADSNSVGVFLNNGDGTFAESAVALPDSATFLILGDFNNDGRVDVVAPMDDGNSSVYIATLPGLGNGTFGKAVVTPVSQYAPSVFWASSADLNGDGYPDLLLLSDAIQEIAVQVFLNNKDGTFSAGQVVAQDSPVDEYLASVLFDADGDGIPDALITDYLGGLLVLHGNGDGTFNVNNANTFEIGDVGYGIVDADVNGDGNLDVIVSGAFINDVALYGTEAGDQICVLEGDGKGNFSVPSLYRGDSSSYSLAVADFRGNGQIDVVTANQDNDSATVFLNDGQGAYGLPEGNFIGYEGGGPVNAPISGVLFTDVNGDGFTDAAFLEYNQPPDSYYQLTVLLNDGTGNLSAPVRSDAVNTNYGAVGDFVLADFRNTGNPDFLAIAPNYENSFLSFAPNTGAGHFGSPTGVTPANATGVIGVGDFNHDEKLDFVAAGFFGDNESNYDGIQVFLGNGDGTFQSGYTQRFGGNSKHVPVAVYVGDFNRDGNLDFLVFTDDNAGWTIDDDVYEFLGNGDGTFQPGQLLFSHFGPMVVADVNNDGYPDIVNMLFPRSTTEVPQPVQFSIYIGQSDGTFTLTNTYTPYGYFGTLPQEPDFPVDTTYAPMVADFNGDGNLDIAAFQQIGTGNIDTFVQLMLGNGDGTFTPTYDVFDFRKPFVTSYAVNLTGTGGAELFELNGYRSTYNLLPGVVAPPFQIAVVEDPVPGPQGTGIIVLDLPSTSSTTISLAASDAAIQVPSTVTIPAGNASQVFSFTIGSSFNFNHVFSITAQLGATSATAYGTAVASGSGFQASVGGGSSWPNVNLAPGQNEADLSVGVTSVSGDATTVTIQCVGLPTNVNCQITPPTLPIRPGDYADSAMSITVGTNTPQGSYPGTVQVTDGVTTKNIPFTLNVGGFSMSLSPQTLQLMPSDNGAYQLTVASLNRFNQAVTLTCQGLPSGPIPPGPTCSTIPFTYPPTGANPVSVGVQTQSLPTGNYQIVVTGTSGPVTQITTAQLQVSDFSASVSPLSATVAAGGSTSFNVAVSPENGFNGSVNFSCSSSSGLISCSFNPSSTTVPASRTATSVLTMTASSQAASTRQRLARRPHVALLAVLSLAFPLGLLVAFSRVHRRSGVILCLLFVMFVLPSCGGGGGSGSTGGGGGGSGGSDGGGGGGGNSQTYSIIVQVTSGSTTHSAGTINLTVN
jgi:hypothetical protein